VLAAFAAQKKLPTSIVETDNPSTKPLVDVLKGIMGKKGASFKAEALVSGTQADFAPVVQKSVSGGAKAVLTFLGPDQAQAYNSALIKSGYKGGIFTSYVWTKGDIAKLGGGSVLSQMMTAQQFLPVQETSNPLVKKFVTDMKAELASGDKDAHVGGPGGEQSTVSGGWLAVWAMAQIAKKQNLKTITAKTVTAALKKTKSLDMQGLMPTWKPNAKGPTGTTRAANDKYFLFRWKNNKIVQLTKSAVSIADIFAGKADSVKFP
jgi:hypothetical protein